VVPPELVIVAAGRAVDGEGSVAEVGECRDRLQESGLRVREYRLAPLRFGWHAPLPAGYLKGACAPIEGLIAAREAIAAETIDAVLISGEDPIKTAFANQLRERERLMRVYGERTFLSAYDELAGALRTRLGLTEHEFERLADCLFENYWSTWTDLHPDAKRPAENWFAKITPHFRGVDCANPSIDFEGALLATTPEHAFAVGFAAPACVTINGMSVERQCDDGIEHIPEIVGYEHLAAAYHAACEQAGQDVGELLLTNRARIEIYTCYPAVPIAFLYATGLAHDPDTARGFLRKRPATITGGLNLARAPWNNSTLNAMVQATHMLRAGGTPIIGIHSVAALGYKQAFAILSAPTTATLA
jgi:hypothetical protein